jgi:hypothetical protein
MGVNSRIEKRCAKVSLSCQTSDFDYWQRQPYQVRLAALEEVRREYHQWRYDAEPRLQRVHTVVER